MTDELPPPPPPPPPPAAVRPKVSARFTLLWVAAGIAFGLVPGIVSQLVRPGWATAAAIEYADAGFAVYLVLLALSGLGIAAVSFWFGATGRDTEGWAAAVRIYGGMAGGTFLAWVILGWNAQSDGAPAMMAFLIGLPYWACAGAGVVLGTQVFRFRTR